MDSLQNRLAFALSYLKDGDDDARLVLSDLLEADGEVALANWLRAKKNNWRKRLDCVIGVMPHLVCLQITCDLMAHSMGLLKNRRLRQAIKALQNVSAWSHGELDDSVIERSLSEISSLGWGQANILNLDLTVQTLHLAISQSLMAATAARETNTRPAIDGSRNACRKVIKASREMVHQHAPNMPNSRGFWGFRQKRSRTAEQVIETRRRYLQEYQDWQFTHTISVIEKLLKSLAN